LRRAEAERAGLKESRELGEGDAANRGGGGLPGEGKEDSLPNINSRGAKRHKDQLQKEAPGREASTLHEVHQKMRKGRWGSSTRFF